MRFKIAIIGCGSFLAQYLIKALDSQHIITGYGRSNPSGLTDYTFFDFPSAKFELSELLNFDYVIYCAGGGIQPEKGNQLVLDLNTYLPIDIALFLQDNSFKGTLITFGSYFEIGNNAETKLFTEEEVVLSNWAVPNLYSVSKRLLSRFFDSADLNIRYLHLILPTIYGKGENPKRLIPYVTNCAVTDTPPQLTSGVQMRQYVHTRDVADLVKQLIGSDIGAGIYNVPSKQTISVRDIVTNIYRSINKPEPEWTDSFQRFDVSMKYLALDSSKIEAALSRWKPKISISDSIAEYLP